MRELTWKAAFGEVCRAAARHRLASALIVVLAVASLAGIAWAGTSSGNSGDSSGSVSSGGAGAVRPAGNPPAAAFSLPALSQSGVSTAERVSLASYSGKPLIVNFFASWCSPCKQETPLLAKFYRGERGKVALVGLDVNDTVANALKFTGANGVSYPIGWDPSVVAANAYGVTALPQTFFLDARHRVVYRVFGAVTHAQLSEGVTLATQD
jgi:cytochrome c biogenesis protein CcmG, thiol:disulfide interchange protein DsbE